MNILERITAFHKLGLQLSALPENDFQSVAEQARRQNPWFTETNIQMAVRGITKLLNIDELQTWTSAYNITAYSKRVAVVMAGNIPMVGFHDLLSVLICGHSILIKCSSKDSILIKFIVDTLIAIEPRFDGFISFADQLSDFDAIIATGSDNTSRYFEYYFGRYPHIIRKNRTSVAIVNGHESDEDIATLGTDVFSYFGLGCRNVSKIFLPEGYSLERIFRCWEPFHEVIHQSKYVHNYDYQKTLLLLTRKTFLDNGFVLLTENQDLVSPIAVIYYEYYSDRLTLNTRLGMVDEKIQCIVENAADADVLIGQAQFPRLGDYADNVDTLKFLTSLN